MTQSLDAYIESHADVLQHGVSEAETAVRHAMAFLRDQCEMPHVVLVPRPTPSLIVLSAFFKAHPTPSPRAQDLLVRWVWRMSFGFEIDQRTLLRNGIAAAKSDGSESAVQRLLALLPADRRPFRVPESFISKAADSRLSLLGLVSLGPLDLVTGNPIDVAALIESAGPNPFRRIWKLHGNPLADRALLPGRGRAIDDLVLAAETGSTAVLASHGVDDECRDALLGDDPDRFIDRRHQIIEAATRDLSDRLAAWDRNDRPSIAALLERAA